MPIYKKEPRKKLENGRPASILTAPSKIYESFIHKKILSIVLSAYRKKCFLLRWIKPCFVNVVKQWKWKKLKETLDKKKIAKEVLMDLKKALDCIPHDLLIATLHAYGFSEDSLVFFYSYLKRH